LIRDTAAGVEIEVRIIPRAKRTSIDGVRQGALLIRVAAAPADNAANGAVLELLSDALRLPRRALKIISGSKDRRKRIAVDGVTADLVRTRLKV
jgi:uncharacterized protein YggU (UPF0235/DUF167 family)